ncbi:ABC transporter ATP-binding protein [Castellaniella sp. GW247-6E4]|uniref:ABC transporter ATP-binding protein n=1 Tax=Castellaniella sp. GW247-6E4 TaxID=3140380 RepID=UPI00331490FE
MTAQNEGLSGGLMSGGEPYTLQADGITMHFGGIKALEEVDFKVQRGKVTGLIGQNGSGKSTLLNVITGELQPKGGQIYFEGERIPVVKPAVMASCGISRVFQSVQVFDRLSVEENIRAAQLPLSRSPRVLPEIADVLRLVGLSDYHHLAARDISYGHRRLLELGMALSTSPKLLLLDEPTAGLSRDSVQLVIDCINDLNAKNRVTMVIVEHEMEVVFRLCHQIYVLDSGKVIAVGSPSDIRKNEDVLRLYIGED